MYRESASVPHPGCPFGRARITAIGQWAFAAGRILICLRETGRALPPVWPEPTNPGKQASSAKVGRAIDAEEIGWRRRTRRRAAAACT